MMVWPRYIWMLLGTSGRLGVWLLLGAAVFWLVQVQPAATQLTETQAKLRQAQQTQTLTAPAKPRRINDFYARFPPLEQLPDQLAALDVAAEAADLAINESYYQLQTVNGLALRRYQVNLPLDGDYPSLRLFLNRALGDAPNAVLDEVRFERDPKSDVVTAQLKLSYYYREATPTGLDVPLPASLPAVAGTATPAAVPKPTPAPTTAPAPAATPAAPAASVPAAATPPAAPMPPPAGARP
ncbi:hypothetical protein GCM10007907_10460 [Chitinimonas prasina]|uniref:Type 4a pilus biogenesis protein PilO n=1 Tax=Chitinimonas prasina TaxID=1434937 RepID=A0ABQ5YG20_9NEIS|nr:hypothetical protein [Chitinimonas prasina]GLR12256.1 hypothetical protein GCM10007907_10460 [Chitinimonas prasina]